MKKLLILLFPITLLLTSCILFQTTDPKKLAEPEELNYETKTINEETEKYFIDITYPEFDNSDELNDVINDSIDVEIELFLDEIEDTELEPGDEFFIGKYSLYVNFEIYSANTDIVSIAFPTSTYMSGAAHPMNYTDTLNYNFVTGEEIELVDMFVPDTDYWTAISYSTTPKLKEVLLEDDLSYDDWIEEGAGPEPENFIAFSLTDEGFVFHFDPYQVAPYAAGPQRIEVPFDELYAILLPPWNGE